MQVKETIGAGIVATSVMTAFSYAMSKMEGENFKEPALLSLFVKRVTPVQNAFINVSGWPVHYTLGCVWAGVYTSWIERLQKEGAWKQAILFGCFSGAVGVAVWKLIFQHHPRPPIIAYRKFYRQLFLAHILFALTLSKTYPLLKHQDAAAIQPIE